MGMGFRVPCVMSTSRGRFAPALTGWARAWPLLLGLRPASAASASRSPAAPGRASQQAGMPTVSRQAIALAQRSGGR